MSEARLPPGITVLERGWLSGNNIVIHNAETAAVVDTGYASHGAQTLALLRQVLGAQALTTIVNTHGHSDHLGGNAAVQAAYPESEIWIPAGLNPLIEMWDESALLLSSTGQTAPPFVAHGVLHAGETLHLGDYAWEIHAAPGHDNHALAYFNREHGILLSGDALWENGFGVVFSELLGDAQGLAKVKNTLDAFARLPLRWVIPGHGAAFTAVDAALERAYSRHAYLQQHPEKIAWHALKALFVFYLLEKRQLAVKQVAELLEEFSFLNHLCTHFVQQSPAVVAARLLAELQASQTLWIEADWIVVA